MADGACVRLEVALRCGGGTISGTVDDHVSPAAPFSGWLELMSALDAACARVSGLPPDGARPGTR